MRRRNFIATALAGIGAAIAGLFGWKIVEKKNPKHYDDLGEFIKRVKSEQKTQAEIEAMEVLRIRTDNYVGEDGGFIVPDKFAKHILKDVEYTTIDKVVIPIAPNEYAMQFKIEPRLSARVWMNRDEPVVEIRAANHDVWIALEDIDLTQPNNKRRL